MNQVNAKKYIAKYISKSFHLRNLYVQHGLKESSKTYTFFKNLYDYEEREALLIGNKHKIDKESLQPLSPNQHIFRKNNNAYFYLTNERLIAQVSNPEIIKKNYRLGIRGLNSEPILNLAKKSSQKESLLLNLKDKQKTLTRDFQEFVITNLLVLCKKAEFLYLPLEKPQVSKDKGTCDKLVYHHFQTKPILRFKFDPKNATTVREFFNSLDDYADYYDMEEAKDFYYYPTSETSKDQARN